MVCKGKSETAAHEKIEEFIA